MENEKEKLKHRASEKITGKKGLLPVFWAVPFALIIFICVCALHPSAIPPGAEASSIKSAPFLNNLMLSPLNSSAGTVL